MRSALSLVLAAACAAGCAPFGSSAPSAYDIDFRGPGKLVVIWETETPAGKLERALVVYDGAGPRELRVADPLDVRWLSGGELLVGAESPPANDDELPRVRLLLVDAGTGASRAFGAPALYFDPEPSPDGRILAVGVQVDEQGGSEFEIWSLDDASAPLVARSLALDEPRWSPDGADLVVTATVEDAEGDDGGLTVEGVGFGFPRLFRVRRDLSRRRLLHDGDAGKEPEPGGSIPLWWDARGIFARQRRGLVRCDPAGSGCALAYDPGEDRRVLGGRAHAGEALLLVVDTRAGAGERTANELHRVDLETGVGRVIFRASGSRFPIELDWGPD